LAASLASRMAKASYAKNRWCQCIWASIMRAMSGFRTDTTELEGAPQGSSRTKVLADYAAMSTESPVNAKTNPTQAASSVCERDEANAPAASQDDQPPREVGGREGPEPTRFGDWEKSGRCIDF